MRVQMSTESQDASCEHRGHRSQADEFTGPYAPTREYQGAASGHWRLTKLRVLALEDRKIEELPDELDELRRLERLHISSPNLRTLPKGIGGLDTLTNLSLSLGCER